jgi:hypothetical protein
MWVLNELFVDPMVPIVATPYLSTNEATRNGSPRYYQGPQMPDFHPGGRRAQMNRSMLLAVGSHSQGTREAQVESGTYLLDGFS